MAAEALEQSVLESKDKDQLLAIAKALGLKATSRTKKAEIIDSILEMTGTPSSVGSSTNGDVALVAAEHGAAEAHNGATAAGNGAGLPASLAVPTSAPLEVPVADETVAANEAESAPAVGADGEPLAEWELTVDSTAPADDSASCGRRSRWVDVDARQRLRRLCWRPWHPAADRCAGRR